MTKFLASKRIGEMNLNRGNRRSHYRIPDGNARMRIRTCVQNDDIKMVFGLLYPSNQVPLRICLTKFCLHSQLLCTLPHLYFDLTQGCLAIDRGLPLTEKV